MISQPEGRFDETTNLESSLIDPAQESSYYGFMPSVLRPARLGSEVRMVVQSAPPISAIFFPSEGLRIPAGNIVVEGFAVATFSEDITRVELSLDGGQTWMETELSDDPLPGVWRFWRKRINPPPGKYVLVIRAVDTSADLGSSDADPAWHKISFEVIP